MRRSRSKARSQATSYQTRNPGQDFCSAHCRVANLFEEDSADLENEHKVLDRHEDDIAATFLRLQCLVTGNHSGTTNQEKALSRKLSRVERRLRETTETLDGVTEDHKEILPLLEQHKEQLADVKRELSVIYEELITIDLPDDHDLVMQHAHLEKVHFDGSHTAKKWIAFHSNSIYNIQYPRYIYFHTVKTKVS